MQEAILRGPLVRANIGVQPGQPLTLTTAFTVAFPLSADNFCEIRFTRAPNAAELAKLEAFVDDFLRGIDVSGQK